MNQCDGCLRGLPTKVSSFHKETLIHYDNNLPVMVCTKELYERKERAFGIPKGMT